MNKQTREKVRIASTVAIVIGSLSAVVWFGFTNEGTPNAVPSHFDGDFRRLINKEQKKAVARQQKSRWESKDKKQRIVISFGRTVHKKQYGVCRTYYTETLFNGKGDRWGGITCKNKLGKWFRL